jgi:hypothetical protein
VIQSLGIASERTGVRQSGREICWQCHPTTSIASSSLHLILSSVSVHIVFALEPPTFFHHSFRSFRRFLRSFVHLLLLLTVCSTKGSERDWFHTRAFSSSNRPSEDSHPTVVSGPAYNHALFQARSKVKPSDEHSRQRVSGQRHFCTFVIGVMVPPIYPSVCVSVCLAS